MRLEMVVPPAVVRVRVRDRGELAPGLLIAVRGDRRYVQVRRGAGLNHLRWVHVSQLG